MGESTSSPTSRKKTPPPHFNRSISEQRPSKGALPPIPVPQEVEDYNKVDDWTDGKPGTPAPVKPPPRGVRRPPPPLPPATPTPTVPVLVIPGIAKFLCLLDSGNWFLDP